MLHAVVGQAVSPAFWGAANMKKRPPKAEDDGLRPEYDLAKLGPGVRGKYYKEAIAGPSVFLIEPDVEEVLPAGDSENPRR